MPITGGVGFVEAVTGEHFDLFEDLVGEFFADAVGGFRAGDEFAAFLGHFLGVLLAHGAAEEVGAAEGVSGEELGGVLDLLLIDHDAVGVSADLFEQRVLVHGFFSAFFDLDHLIDELHGAGAVEGEEVDDVVDFLDLVFAAGFDHSAGFELEHAHGLAAVEDVEGLLVVEGDFLDAEAADFGADVVDGFLDDGEVFQPEEVHFEESDLGDGTHVILGDDFALVADC